MATYSTLIAVGTTATPLNTHGGSADSGTVIYNDGAVRVHIGGADVTTTGATKGVPLDPGVTLSLEGQSDVLYGLVAAATCDIIVLELGAD